MIKRYQLQEAAALHEKLTAKTSLRSRLFTDNQIGITLHYAATQDYRITIMDMETEAIRSCIIEQLDKEIYAMTRRLSEMGVDTAHERTN